MGVIPAFRNIVSVEGKRTFRNEIQLPLLLLCLYLIFLLYFRPSLLLQIIPPTGDGGGGFSGTTTAVATSITTTAAGRIKAEDSEWWTGECAIMIRMAVGA